MPPTVEAFGKYKLLGQTVYATLAASADRLPEPPEARLTLPG